MDLSAAFLTACLGLQPKRGFIQGSIVQPLQSFLLPNLPVLRGFTLLAMGGLSLSKAVVNFMTVMKVLLVPWSAEWMMVMLSGVILPEGSLEVKLPTIRTYGKAEVGRVREEKRRREERKKRSEKRRSQKKEDAGAIHGVFDLWLWRV